MMSFSYGLPLDPPQFTPHFRNLSSYCDTVADELERRGKNYSADELWDMPRVEEYFRDGQDYDTCATMVIDTESERECV